MTSCEEVEVKMNGSNKKERSMPRDIGFHFPPELLTEHIFPRLPVKTLLIFRSVCKAWCSAIDDRAFVSKHLKLSNNNCNKNNLLAIENAGPDCIRSATVFDRYTLRRGLTFRNIFDGYMFVMSCNGLILVQNVVNGNLNICNISIEKTLVLPPCPLVAPSLTARYLFGFRPSTNEYVVIGIFTKEHGSSEKLVLALYRLSDNLWRKGKQTWNLPSWIYPTIPTSMFSGKSVYFDGALHWLGNDVDNNQPWKTQLVSFNFDTVRFSAVQLPGKTIGTFRFLFVLGESLATFSISSESSSIWVLKNKTWDLRVLTFSNAAGFKYISEHTHVISNCFYLEDGGITLVYGNVAYKIMTDEVQHISTWLSCFVCLDDYVESLVLHKGCPGEMLSYVKDTTKQRCMDEPRAEPI